MKAYILAGGKGTRLWPYNEYRNKAALPIANRPLALRTVEAAVAAGVDSVVLAASSFVADLKRIFLGDARVTVVETKETCGSAETMEAALAAVPCEDDALVLFGDCLYDAADLAALVEAHKANKAGVTALVSPMRETDDAGDWLTIRTNDEGAIRTFAGHTDDPKYQVMEAFTFRAHPENGLPMPAYLGS
ncbi:MAG: NDP-sugar synthase, partial [Clostridia bacterium]|nr:NDP-sugar synthase [Clostridia bacterium]